MALYGYCRVSTALQAREGESLDAQERKLHGWAMMNGGELAGLFVEEGVSGSMPVRERPAGAELLAALKPGDTVVAIKLDRMFRSALDALQTVEVLRERGVGLVLLDLGGDVVANGMSKLFLTLCAAFAEAERDRIRERIADSKADAKARGRYLGGAVPFGFRVVEGALEAIPADQELIAHVQGLRGSGMTLRAILASVEASHSRRLSLKLLHRLCTSQDVA